MPQTSRDVWLRFDSKDKKARCELSGLGSESAGACGKGCGQGLWRVFWKRLREAHLRSVVDAPGVVHSIRNSLRPGQQLRSPCSSFPGDLAEGGRVGCTINIRGAQRPLPPPPRTNTQLLSHL